MFALGTIINTLAVIAGGMIGMTLKNGLKQRFQETIMQGLGLAVLFVGVAGAMTGMLEITDGQLNSTGSYVLVVSMVVGAVIGEAINVEYRVGTSLVICVGAMAIVGALQDGLAGDSSILISKAMMDFVIVMVFASALGIGTVFSAIPIFIYQGAITVCASFLAPYFTDTVVASLSFVGSVLIFAVGTNLCFQTKIKVGNLLPAIFVAMILALFL